MSVSNLFSPNDYDIFTKSLNTSGNIKCDKFFTNDLVIEEEDFENLTIYNILDAKIITNATDISTQNLLASQSVATHSLDVSTTANLSSVSVSGTLQTDGTATLHDIQTTEIVADVASATSFTLGSGTIATAIITDIILQNGVQSNGDIGLNGDILIDKAGNNPFVSVATGQNLYFTGSNEVRFGKNSFRTGLSIGWDASTGLNGELDMWNNSNTRFFHANSTNLEFTGNTSLIKGRLGLGDMTAPQYVLDTMCPTGDSGNYCGDIRFGSTAGFVRVDLLAASTGTGVQQTTMALNGNDGSVVLGQVGDYVNQANITGDTYLRSLNNIRLEAGGGNQIRIYVKDDGKVGVGTITPSEALDVVGNIQINNGSLQLAESSSTIALSNHEFTLGGNTRNSVSLTPTGSTILPKIGYQSPFILPSNYTYTTGDRNIHRVFDFSFKGGFRLNVELPAFTSAANHPPITHRLFCLNTGGNAEIKFTLTDVANGTTITAPNRFYVASYQSGAGGAGSYSPLQPYNSPSPNFALNLASSAFVEITSTGGANGEWFIKVFF